MLSYYHTKIKLNVFKTSEFSSFWDFLWYESCYLVSCWLKKGNCKCLFHDYFLNVSINCIGWFMNYFDIGTENTRYLLPGGISRKIIMILMNLNTLLLWLCKPLWEMVWRNESSTRRQCPSDQHWGSPPTTSSHKGGICRPGKKKSSASVMSAFKTKRIKARWSIIKTNHKGN